MGKLVLAMIVSIDGFITGPDGEMDWIFPHIGPDLQRETLEGLHDTHTLLVGRKAYEGMAGFWPTQDDPLAGLMNELPKLVFSRTLDKVEWQNSRLAGGDAAAEVGRLKEQSDRDCRLLGGADLAQSLSSQGLIDEFRLITVPVVLGAGKPLFTEPLDLALDRSVTYDQSAILSVYHPARPE